MAEQGWLKRQLEAVEADVKKWPNWLKREAGLAACASESTVDPPGKTFRSPPTRPAQRMVACQSSFG